MELDNEGCECLIKFTLPSFREIWSGMLEVLSGRVAREEVSILNAFQYSSRATDLVCA